jgi:hypothetical protein
MPGFKVGTAYVEVNMRFDDKSIGEVGKDIKRQLSTLNKDIAKVGRQNRDTYRSFGQGMVTAWRTFLGAVMVGAPHIGGAISGIAGAATELVGALYSVGKESAALLPMFTSLGVAGLTLKIGMRGFAQAVSETNPKALKEMLADMPKSMQNAVLATRKLSNEMRAAIWPKLFAGLSDGIEKLRNTGVIQRGLGLMADQLNGLAKAVLNYANSKEGVSTLNKFFQNNAKVFGALSKIAVPFLDGFLRLINALSPAAIRLANGITDVAKSFQKWTKGAGFGKRVDDSMKGAAKTAGYLWRILGNLGKALNNIFNALNPSTNTFLQMLEDVTQRFEDWTASAGGKNTIAEWGRNANDMMQQVGHTIEAIWPVMVKLADPRLIGNFLKTIEGAFNILNKLPLEQAVNAFIKISDAMQPISSLFLAIIIAGAAFNIMVGNIIGQMGGFFSILTKFLRFRLIIKILRDIDGAGGAAAKKVGILRRAWEFLVRIFGKVKNLLSPVLKLFGRTGAETAEAASGAGRLAGALGPVLRVLSVIAKFAGWAGLVIWIGILIAKSKDLQAKLGELWDAFKGVFSQLGKSLAEIGTALKPLAPVGKAAGKAFSFIFDILDKLMTLGIGLVLDAKIYALKSLGKVIEGLGHIIAGLITVLIGLFTLDWGMMWKGLKQMASGVWPLLQGLFGLFISFFAPARFLKLGWLAIRGLGAGVKAAMPAIGEGIARFLPVLLEFLAKMAPKMLKLGAEAIVWLGKGIVKATPIVLRFAGRLVVDFLKWYVRLPDRLFRLGVAAIRKLGSAVVKYAPVVMRAAGRLVAGVVGWIARLPGRLLALGKSAITSLGTALRNGLGALRGIASTIVTSIVNIIKTLPGKLLGIGGALLAAGVTLGGKILSGIRSGITAIGDMAGSVASSLKAGINAAIGLPKSLSFKVLGKSIGFTIPGFEKGGLAPGGLATVGEGGPELVSLPRGARVHSNRESKKMMGSTLPKTLVLRIGSRDFIAYVEELADNRINAADNLAWQGA